jgi:transcriptional regulator with XRE-family HTH domain
VPGQHFPVSSAESGAVVTKAAIRAADQLKISSETLAAIIGVSEVTISRIRRGGSALEPGTKPFELAVLFVQLFRSLDAIVGGDDEIAASWLASANIPLNARPIEKLQTVAGLVDVIAYLDARRALN